MNAVENYDNLVASMKIRDKIKLKIFREDKIFEAKLDIIEKFVLPRDFMQPRKQEVSMF